MTFTVVGNEQNVHTHTHTHIQNEIQYAVEQKLRVLNQLNVSTER